MHSQLYQESEHQELFYPQTDLHQPLSIHIPSAMARLGYYVCVRIRGDSADALRDAETRLVVGGRHAEDVVLRPAGEDMQIIASREEDFVWAVLGRAMLSRGDGTATFSRIDPALPRCDLLLCTWLRFVTSGRADDWLAVHDDPAWAPTGVPLGGIGTGKIEICRDGRFRNYSGNNNQDMPLEEPKGIDGALLSVAEDDARVALTTRPTDGLPPCRRLEFSPEFPHAGLEAPDVLDGIDVSVRLAGPLVPHNLEISCLPGFLVRWTVRNRRRTPARVACRLDWPNLVGLGGGIGEPESYTGYGDGRYIFWTPPEGADCEQITSKDFSGIRYKRSPSPIRKSGDGHHYVVVRQGPRSETFCNAVRGGVQAQLEIPAEGEGTAEMAVVWEMPHFLDALLEDRGLYWQNVCNDGTQILTKLLSESSRILTEGNQLTRLLAETDLPHWLQRRLANCCYPLVTNSVFYRDGRFSINEGPGEMAGCYGTMDQRLGAHPATQILFPELNRIELELFADVQAANGGINHDLGYGHLERKAVDRRWPDVTCSFVIQLARHAWTTGDRVFERKAWPWAKKAMARHAEWSIPGGGVAQLSRDLGTSYDSYKYYGTSPYVGTVWIAALATAKRWAIRMDASDLAEQYDCWIKDAEMRIRDDLWNGRFLRAFADRRRGRFNENSHAGMIAGEYFARMLTGCDVLDEQTLRSCIDAMLELNFAKAFVIPPDEVSIDGQAQSEFGWLPYVECFCLAPMAVLKYPAVVNQWSRIVDAMDDAGRHTCDTRLMYRPGTGEPSWGAWYMTAPASFLVYDALLDFQYQPETQTLRLDPALEGRFAVLHPRFWAVGQRQGESICLTIKAIFGDQACRVERIEAPRGRPVMSETGELYQPAGEEGVYTSWRIEPVKLETGARIAWRQSS